MENFKKKTRFITLCRRKITLLVMLMLHPVGGAMLLKSLGTILEEGRRGSMPQAHTLFHKVYLRKPVKKRLAVNEKKSPATDFFFNHFLNPSEILWSKKLNKKQREKYLVAMTGEEQKRKKLPSNTKLQPKFVENLKKKTHFTR